MLAATRTGSLVADWRTMRAWPLCRSRTRRRSCRCAHDSGRWDAEGRKGWIRGTLHDFAVVDAGYCESLCASLTRACTMTGAGRVYVVERQCRARRAESCVFEGTW